MTTSVWVGLKTCGCCVAVCVDRHEQAQAKHVEKTKREFLRDGLSVVHGTWDEWLTKYMPSLRSDCPHDTPTAVATSDGSHP